MVDLSLTRPPDRRWDADFLTLSRLLRSDTLGRITEFETHFDRHSPVVKPGRQWKTRELGGSVVYDLGTHLMDQVVVLFGMPKRITALIGTQREGRPASDEDSCTVLLHYEGMLATVKAAVVSPETRQLRFWVRGEGGSFKKVGFPRPVIGTFVPVAGTYFLTPYSSTSMSKKTNSKLAGGPAIKASEWKRRIGTVRTPRLQSMDPD